MRFERQLDILGKKGQDILKKSTVAVFGCGGLGCQVITNLASAGVGNFIIVDSDVVSESNLNRQFVYSSSVGKSKVDVMEEWIKKIDSSIKVKKINEKFDGNFYNFEEADIVVDCFDNIQSKLILAHCCLEYGKIMVHGAVDNLFGQVTSIYPDGIFSLDKIYRSNKEIKHNSISSCVSLIGAHQANEVIKILTGVGIPLKDVLLTFDFENNEFKRVNF